MMQKKTEPLHLTVNGEEHELQVPSHRMLVDVLREDLKLTGTKRSCDIGVCGACTVLVDDTSVSSCLMLAVRADGRRVVTIEGLASAQTLHPIQEAFLQEWGFQCGYCTPGFLMTTVELLAAEPNVTPAMVREELMGNLCRCTGYEKIVASIMAAAERLRAARASA